jgi:hypothetical protein
MVSQNLEMSRAPRSRITVEPGVQKAIDENRAAAFSLLLSLHKYSRWVSSLQSSRPTSAAAAGKELQRVNETIAYFPELGRQVSNVLALHLELIECLRETHGTSDARDILPIATRQGEAVAKLSASCERLTPRP